MEHERKEEMKREERGIEKQKEYVRINLWCFCFKFQLYQYAL